MSISSAVFIELDTTNDDSIVKINTNDKHYRQKSSHDDEDGAQQRKALKTCNANDQKVRVLFF